jgi:hypothetical protein
MFSVEIYAGGSTVCLRRREEPARGGAGFGIESGYDFQDVPAFGAASKIASMTGTSGPSFGRSGALDRKGSLSAAVPADPLIYHWSDRDLIANEQNSNPYQTILFLRVVW